MADKVFAGARGGKLALKGVAPGPSGGVKKRKKAVESEAPEPVPEVAGIGGEVGSAKPNKTYEELFPSEARKAARKATSSRADALTPSPAEAHGRVQRAYQRLGQQRARRARRAARLRECPGTGGPSHRRGAAGPAERTEG